MDTLFWKNLSSNSIVHSVDIKQATKQFFNEYFYKLEIHAPGCKSIRKPDIVTDISNRRLIIRSYNHGGSWYDKKMKKYLNEADIGFLTSLSNIIYEYPEVKLRVEEPILSIYAVDELMIKSVAQSIDPSQRDKIRSITGPLLDEHKKIISKSAILVKRPPKFKFRIWLKEKQFTFETRYQLYNYLMELGDLVKMTEHTRNSLTKSHDWIWGSYFYTNDAKIATFITLINPDIIREVSEFVYLDNK